jgi:glycosyltransferase involved in cell wall biosynthesis
MDNHKKTILHIIDDFGRGGAETMVVAVIKKLNDYNNIVVTLYPKNEFENELKYDKYYCLNLHSPLLTPLAAFQLRKIIKDNKVSLVHSHLFWSTVVARMGVPKKVQLVTTIHTFIANSIEYRPWVMKVIEKASFKIRKSIIIAVAKGAFDEYFNYMNVKPRRAYILYTFVDTSIFSQENSNAGKENTTTFRLISVGNLKKQKNHHLLLEAFKELKNENISLDIYGKGFLDTSLQEIIDVNQLNVTLKGQVTDIQLKIPQYDLFVMSSLYEGFALSVLEAMALGMPLLLTDIVSFKEQCADTAVYYDDTKSFISKVLDLKNNLQYRKAMGDSAKKRVLENYTLDKHMLQLKMIYAEALGAV